MSEEFVRSVLREHAEEGMPTGKDPWPAIKQSVQAAQQEHRTETLHITVVSDPRRQKVEASHIDRWKNAYPGARRFRFNMATAMVVLLALAAGTIAIITSNGLQPIAGITPSLGCWRIGPGPEVEVGDTILTALSARSADDVWAVGYSNAGGQPRTLVQRWNGQRWSTVASANVESRSNYLTGVAALAPNNVWAVGYHCTGNCDTDVAPLAQHWDGARWSMASTPGSGRLNGLAAVSANDIWAVGNNAQETLALHWDGSRWTGVPTNDPPLPSSVFILNAVTAISSNDVWAVGQEHDTAGNRYKKLIYHWDGNRWASFSETGASLGIRLYSVAATSPGDVWAVGERDNNPSTEEPLETATMHWDGANWIEVPSPNVGAGGSYLRGVEAISPTDAWALGGYGPITGTKQTLVLHWDGALWSVVPSPNVEGQSSRFFSADALSANEIWAIGTYNLAGTGTFVERYNNPCIATTPKE
ncbi:MAG TPA: hypothetical protein VGE45_12405 [Chloroflexia bacterium]